MGISKWIPICPPSFIYPVQYDRIVNIFGLTLQCHLQVHQFMKSVFVKLCHNDLLTNRHFHDNLSQHAEYGQVTMVAWLQTGQLSFLADCHKSELDCNAPRLCSCGQNSQATAVPCCLVIIQQALIKIARCPLPKCLQVIPVYGNDIMELFYENLNVI